MHEPHMVLRQKLWVHSEGNNDNFQNEAGEVAEVRGGRDGNTVRKRTPIQGSSSHGNPNSLDVSCISTPPPPPPVLLTPPSPTHAFRFYSSCVQAQGSVKWARETDAPSALSSGWEASIELFCSVWYFCLQVNEEAGANISTLSIIKIDILFIYIYYAKNTFQEVFF